MITRRSGREWALQMICQIDLNPPDDLEQTIANFWTQQEQVERDSIAEGVRNVRVIFTSEKGNEKRKLSDIRRFAEERVRGVVGTLKELDDYIEPFLENWPLYRLGTIERNVLRLGVWELLNCNDIPSPIIINEAIDIAKYFSDSKGGRFVNGVLDKFNRFRVNQTPETVSGEE